MARKRYSPAHFTRCGWNVSSRMEKFVLCEVLGERALTSKSRQSFPCSRARGCFKREFCPPAGFLFWQLSRLILPIQEALLDF